MTAQVRELHCTYIWTESYATLLGAVPAVAPMAWLADKPAYAAQFVQALARQGQGEPCVPWLHEHGHAYNHFWRYYLPRLTPKIAPAAAAEMAWRKVTPLRMRPAVTLAIDGLADPAALDAFVYPHAISVAVTLFMKGAHAMADLHALADSLRNRMTTLSTAGAAVGTLPLPDAAQHVLRLLRQAVLGDPDAETTAGDPFIVATLVDGAGIDGANAPDPSMLRAAEALCSWKQLPPNFVPRPQPQASVKLSGAAPSQILYRLDRGRTVWFPDWLSADATRNKVKCYHRNLSAASMQVDALAALLGLAESYLSSGNNLPFYFDDLVRNATLELSLFYSGDRKSTYRSRSLCAQIVDNGTRDLLDLARPRFSIGAKYDPAKTPC
ncbi:MAG: hypothetical protein HZB53_19630 [Chloroflexi bacterium]|nr:hypothetical protein [Chloroflexota bacterium]